MNIEVEDLIVANVNNINVISKENCDKFDYLVAVACGVLGGLVDMFLVGAPGKSVLSNWTDKQVDKVVIKFAKCMRWNPINQEMKIT